MSPTETALGDSNNAQPQSGPWWKSTRAIAIAALVIAVIGTAVAIVVPRVHLGASYSDEQTAQAKAAVCSAWAPVRKSVWLGTPNPRRGDPVAQLAVAANVRLAELGGGSYLKETLAEQPATPADLAKAVTAVANTLQKMGVIYLARNDSPALIGPLHNALDTEGAEVGKLCK